jgi:hypothetical protein
MPHRTAHPGRRLVLAQTLVHDLAQQIVVGPGQKLDLGDHFGPHPMHAAEHQRRSEAAGTRRQYRRLGHALAEAFRHGAEILADDEISQDGWDRFVDDSALEEGGFELSVPGGK